MGYNKTTDTQMNLTTPVATTGKHSVVNSIVYNTVYKTFGVNLKESLVSSRKLNLKVNAKGKP